MEDAKRVPEADVIELAKQVQHLRNYLSAAFSDGDLRPADMAEYGFSTSSELLDLCSAVRPGSPCLTEQVQLRVNSFTLASPSLSPIGVAMSPIVALCNHSCQPNAAVVFPAGGGEMVIVAIGDIQPGEEVCAVGDVS